MVDEGASHFASVREAAVTDNGGVNVSQDLSSSIDGGSAGGGLFSRSGEGANPVAEAEAADGLVMPRGRRLHAECTPLDACRLVW